MASPPPRRNDSGWRTSRNGTVEAPISAIETDKNLFVVALAGAGFAVYPINPRALARYRERHGQVGGKSDPADATALAYVLRTDRHLHRPLPANSDGALRVTALARQHPEAIWALHQTVGRLPSVLLEFYPQAVTAFPNLQHYAATAVLAAAPTPAAGQRLTSRQIEAIFHCVGRCNYPPLVKQVRANLRAPALRQSEPVETALGVAVTGLLKIIEAMRGCRGARTGAHQGVGAAASRTDSAIRARHRCCARGPDPRRDR